MQDPPVVPINEEYAAVGARLRAFVVDGLLLGVVWFLVLLVIELAGGAATDDNAGFIIVSVLVGIAWDVLWIAGPARGKPGQRGAGFLVLTVDGGRVSIGRALLRSIAKYVTFAFFIFGLLADALLVAASPRRQAIHDMVASTVCRRRAAMDDAASVQHVPTAEQRAPSIEAPPQSETARHQGPFL